MLTLQKKLSYEGDLSKAPVTDITLEFRIPVYEYSKENSESSGVFFKRTAVSSEVIPDTKKLKSIEYLLNLPEDFIIGKEDAIDGNFEKYIDQSLGRFGTLDDFLTKIDVQYLIGNKIKIGTNYFEAIFFFKLKNNEKNNIKIETLKKNIFLINKAAYYDLLKALSTPSKDEFYLLEIISYLVDINGKYPFLLEDFNEDTVTDKLQEQRFDNPDDPDAPTASNALAIIKKHFIDLFDFPLSIPEIKIIDLGGSFEVKTSDGSKIVKEDLLYYDLSVEYSISNAEKNNSLQIIHFDWNKINKIEKNSVPFSFKDNPIIINGIIGLVSVNVKGFDGSVLYAKEFKPEDSTLKDIQIEVPLMRPITLTPLGENDPVDKNKKLRGQVLVLSKKCPEKDLTVLIQAKKDGDKIWRIVAASKTNSSGNFSIPYPYGIYTEAQAIVSLTPNNPVAIPIIANNENNQTISDDFLYLLVKDADCTPKKEERDCQSPKKKSRLPDYADLIESDEYSQDIGGSCVNLSAPNRTLSEYNYEAIVRTSDPDVANYTLTKIVSDQANKAYLAAQAELDAKLQAVRQAAHATKAAQVAQAPQVAKVTKDAKVAQTALPALEAKVAQANEDYKKATTVEESSYASSKLAGALMALKTCQDKLDAAQAALADLDAILQGFQDTQADADQAANDAQANLDSVARFVCLGTSYELVGGAEKMVRKPVDLNNPIAWQDAPDDKRNLSFYQAVTIATGHILHYKALFKADGYSLGDLLYSLPLAPGQKKEIVVIDSSHTLQGAESQTSSQSERLAAGIIDEREIINQLGGRINESLRGSSSANTSGISAGTGTAFNASYGSMSGGGVLGVSGGVANSNSSASQDSSRDVSQFFGEKLRQSIMQNAEGYRQLNASVITTVQEGQRYAVTTEVVANHNHCHALTMMYFEVLRHYAIYQKLSSVEECVFVPLLMTKFSTENIFKWGDVLATHLLPIPSNTYLQPYSSIGFGRQHPLLKAFDANERIKTNYANIDFPLGSYDDEKINFIKGEIIIRTNLQRPKTRYDRILSLPITTSNTGGAVAGGVVGIAAGAAIGAFIVDLFVPGAGLFIGAVAGGAAGTAIGAESVKKAELVKKQIFDSFMQMDANYQTVPPSQCIRIINFQSIPVTVEGKTIPVSGLDFFDNGGIDKQLWSAYATILGYTKPYPNPLNNVLDMLDYYFKDRLIAEWDEIYYNDIVPIIFDKIVESINIELISTDMTSMRYNGGERLMRINFTGNTNKKRNEFPLHINMFSSSDNIKSLINLVTLDIENVNIIYSTSHYNGILFSGYMGNDLLDGVDLYIPENSEDKRNPRREDVFLVNKLIEHLNSNLEHYNRVLWYNLDQERRYMLLDGFNIQIFIFKGLNPPEKGFRSLASVVKNELITVTGNSLVFPVAAGYKVSQSFITEIRYLFSWDDIPGNDNVRVLKFLKQNFDIDWVNTPSVEKIDDDQTIKISDGEQNYLSLKLNDEQTEVNLEINDVVTDKFVVKIENGKLNIYEDGNEKVTLFDHYKPLTPIEPYRISVPSKGVFVEAVQGACNACEKIETDRLQDWARFPNVDEPTSILPITAPTPGITDWKAAFKDFVTPMINIQNAPPAPSPGAGLSGLSELLGQSGVFKDITGLDANQQNVLKTYLSNQENAKAFGEMAKEMVMQGHNTVNSAKIMDSIKGAKNDGNITQDEASKLVKEQLQQQIDGGKTKTAELEKENSVKPILSEAAVKAVDQGKVVKAQKINKDGTAEAVEISGNSSETILQDPDGQHWFKTEKGMQPLRYGNKVIGLIDGSETFASMVDAIETATSDAHYIYILGWWMELDFELVPGRKPKGGSPDTRLINLLTNAINKGVQVRAMIWDDATYPIHPSISNWNTPQVRKINNIPNKTELGITGTPIVVGSAAAILDNNTLNIGSHHQKILIVKGEEGLIGFCGGVDFNLDRIQSLPPPRQAGSPMHDVHCRIEGPASWDLLQIFVIRWTDHPKCANLDKQKGVLRGISEPIPAQSGDKHVQIGRTFGNGSKHKGITNIHDQSFYSFAPNGERTAESIIFHAIEQAQRFIYIEEQYLVSMDASEKLRAQLPKIQRLIILIPHSSLSDHPFIWEMRKNFIDHLKSDPTTRDKVVVCYRILQPTPHSYIHSKMFIIDDKFAIIGSANCNNRGYTHDSEVVAGIFDEPMNNASKVNFAHELRMQLWAEHLNLSIADVIDPIVSAGYWFSPSTKSSIAIYDQNEDTDSFGIKPTKDQTEPFGG